METTPGFQQLEQELSAYTVLLAQAADVILEQGVSNYPIFVVHQHTMDIGINIVEKEAAAGGWSVNASTLEEFVTKQIIAPEKLEDFKMLYKTHGLDLCLFVLSELGAKFIFLPRKPF